ncbi:MAG: hypothetical protein AB7I18_14135 [Candidatus Berkiella sp.]
MQQGPVSPEMMRQKIQAIVQSLAANPAMFDAFVVKTNDNQIDASKTLTAKMGFLKIFAAKNGIGLNDKQLKIILQQAGVTADQILALQDKPTDPNKRLAVQMALAMSVALIKPSASVLILGNYATRQGAHYLLDSHLGIFNSAIETVIALLNMSNYFNLTNLGSSVLELVDQHRYLSVIAVPLAMIAYAKGPEFLKQLDMSHYHEAAGDLLDMMGGFASDETHEKYRGSIATMTPEEVVSSIGSGVTNTLSWLWNKVPAIRTPAQATTAEPDTRTNVLRIT